jgi:hypothetical protein
MSRHRSSEISRCLAFLPRTAAITAVLGACGAKEKAAPARWAHEEATWDREKWKQACGPDGDPLPSEHIITWSRQRADTGSRVPQTAAMVNCHVAFDRGRPLRLAIGIHATSREIPALLERPLDAMASEVPPEVAGALRRLALGASEGRSGAQRIGAFQIVASFHDRSTVVSSLIEDQWVAEVSIDVSPRIGD